MNEILVTSKTIFLKKLGVFLFDPYRFTKVLKGKSFGMMIAVLCFGKILGDESLGDMAIVACRDGMMGALSPRVELLVHYVTIFTGSRIVGEIRKPSTVVECVKPKTDKRSDNRSDKDGEQTVRTKHPSLNFLTAEIIDLDVSNRNTSSYFGAAAT